MGIAEDIADKLAADVIAYVEKTGDEDIITKMGQTLGDSSQTLQEAFITSVRVQRAALRANAMLAERLAAFGGTAPALAPAPAVERPEPEPAAPIEIAEAPPEPEPEAVAAPDEEPAAEAPEPPAAPDPGPRPARNVTKRKPPVPTIGGGGRPKFG